MPADDVIAEPTADTAETDAGWNEGVAADAGGESAAPAPETKPDAAAPAAAPAATPAADAGDKSPVDLAEERAKEKADKARDAELAAVADRERAARAAQPAAGGKFDVKEAISKAASYLDEQGMTFTNPDPDSTDPVKFSDVLKEYPTLVEIAIALSSMYAKDAVSPVLQKIAATEGQTEYQNLVKSVEDPAGPAKMPPGSVAKLTGRPDFNEFFDKERPSLAALVDSNDPADVAMALRAFANAKGIDLGDASPASDAQRAAVDRASAARKTTTDLHRGTQRQHEAARGGKPALTPAEEEDEGWNEGKREDEEAKRK